MAYWIYNMGLPVPITSSRLLAKHSVRPLSKLIDPEPLQPSHEQRSNIIHSSVGGYQQQHQSTPKPIHLARHIMSSKVKTLPSDASLADAWQQFNQTRFRHFLVVNTQQQLVGIVSDRDMLTQVAKGKSKQITLDKFMKAPVLTADDDTGIREICEVMFNQHIGALPITDNNSNIHGIITRSDILRSMIKHGPLELWA